MRSPRISFLIHTFLLILLLPLTVQAADRGMKVISIKFNPGAELKINRGERISGILLDTTLDLHLV